MYIQERERDDNKKCENNNGMKCKEQIKSINLTELGSSFFLLYKLKNCSQITNDISLHQHLDKQNCSMC